MIPLYTTPPHATEGVSSGLQQTAETHTTNSVCAAELFGLGFVLILMILVSEQIAISLHKRYRLHRIIVSLQRRATLERLMHCKSLSKPRKGSSRQP